MTKEIQRLKDITMKPPFMARQMLADITTRLMFEKPEGLEKMILEKQQDKLLLEIMVDKF